jgi:hypothetical protein
MRWWFYLKMWMNTHIQWNYVECLPVETERTPWHTTYTTCAAHYHVYTENKLFEFLKYNNICSLIAIVNESISKLCGLSTKYAQIWGTVKIMPCYIYSSTENEARARFELMTLHKPKYAKKKESQKRIVFAWK